MEMNGEARGLNALQRSYNACLTQAMQKFMELPKEARVQQAKKEPEFCVDEKRDLYEFMRSKLPIEYENLDRLDEQIYL